MSAKVLYLGIKEKNVTGLESLAKQLEDFRSKDNRFIFNVNPIPGEIEVLQIVVEDREELPIFLSVSDEQILCIAYLFKNNEVDQQLVSEMSDAMLSANISIPLSSFAKIDDQYVLYGALSINSSTSEVIHEIETLSSNTIEAIEAMRNYLN